MVLIETFTFTWLDANGVTAQTRLNISSEHVPYQYGSSDYETFVRVKMLDYMFSFEHISGCVIVNATRSRDVMLPKSDNVYGYDLRQIPHQNSDVRKTMLVSLRTDENTITHVSIPGWHEDYTTITSQGERIADFSNLPPNDAINAWSALMQEDTGAVTPADFMPISDARGARLVSGISGFYRFRERKIKR